MCFEYYYLVVSSTVMLIGYVALFCRTQGGEDLRANASNHSAERGGVCANTVDQNKGFQRTQAAANKRAAASAKTFLSLRFDLEEPLSPSFPLSFYFPLLF